MLMFWRPCRSCLSTHCEKLPLGYEANLPTTEIEPPDDRDQSGFSSVLVILNPSYARLRLTANSAEATPSYAGGIVSGTLRQERSYTLAVT